MSVKLILHDWDDTITNSFETYEEWWNELAEYYKLDRVSVEQLRSNWGKTLFQMMESIWGLESNKSYEMINNFVPQKDYTPTLFEGVKDLIVNLHGQGLELGILSSGHLVDIEASYSRYIAPDFKYHKYVYTHDNLKYTKPDPRAFSPVLEATKDRFTKEEIIYIGDSLYDFYAARDVGIKFIAVTTGLVSKEEFEKAGLLNRQIISKLDTEQLQI